MSLCKFVKRLTYNLGLFLPALVYVSGVALAAKPDLTGLGYQQNLGASLPMSLVFHDEQGEALTLRSAVDGRPALLILGYFACPSLCGAIRDDTLSAINRTNLVAGRDYSLLFLSIDAKETSPMAASAKADDLRSYPTVGAAIGWRFLTGRQEDIDAVEQAVGFHARYDAALKQ